MSYDQTAYHHSVRHYHSPFKMEHRNASAFPDQRTPGQREAQEAALRQREVLESYREATDPTSPQREAAANRARQRGTPRMVVPGMMPNLAADSNAASDHFWGASMSPSRMSFDRAVTIADDTARTGVQGPIPTHDQAVLSREEAHEAWVEEKHLRYGVHKARRIPYVGRDEYVDPLRRTNPTVRSSTGYSSRPVNPKHPTSRFGAVRQECSIGSRRAPAHAVELPEKVNWHDPFRPPATADERRIADETASLRRLPATALLTEVEERLRLHGMGSLLDVRFASDETITALLRDCGFSPTQRMTILWELRKRHPANADASTAASRHYGASPR